MAEATKTITMDVPADALMAVITDYASYPSFVTGMKSARIVTEGGGEGQATRVEYNVDIMGKSITYTLDHVRVNENELKWTLVSSPLMKDNFGAWLLKPNGQKTEVTYTLGLELNFSVPGFVMKSLVASSLPVMMSSFEKRAKEVKRG